GGPSVNAAAALPTFSRPNVIFGAGTPTSEVGKEIDEGDPSERPSVAPLGMTERGIATLLCPGSFVNRLRDPLDAAPAVAAPGTLAATTNDPEPPSSRESDAGDTEKPSPTVVALTTRGTGPEPMIEK